MKVRTTTVTTTMMMIMTSRVSTCSYSERKRNTELLHRSLYTCSTLYTVFQYNTYNFPDDVTKLPGFVTSNFKFVYSSIAYRYISYWYFLNSLNVLNVLLSIKHMSDCTHVCLVKCIKATVYSCMIMNERLRTVLFWLVQNVCGYSLRTICTCRKVRVQNHVVFLGGHKALRKNVLLRSSGVKENLCREKLSYPDMVYILFSITNIQNIVSNSVIMHNILS